MIVGIVLFTTCVENNIYKFIKKNDNGDENFNNLMEKVENLIDNDEINRTFDGVLFSTKIFNLFTIKLSRFL